MLDLEQAYSYFAKGFVIEAKAADGEIEGVIDPFYVGHKMAREEFAWHLDQGHTLVKTGLSDGDLPF
jgi:hypothetical protein